MSRQKIDIDTSLEQEADQPNRRTAKRLRKQRTQAPCNAESDPLVDAAEALEPEEGSLDFEMLLESIQDMSTDPYEATYSRLFRVFKPKKVVSQKSSLV